MIKLLVTVNNGNVTQSEYVKIDGVTELRHLKDVCNLRISTHHPRLHGGEILAIRYDPTTRS